MTKVFDTQNDWACGTCPSSGILNIRKNIVSENGTLFRLQVKERDT
jgi:hypothetical protein